MIGPYLVLISVDEADLNPVQVGLFTSALRRGRDAGQPARRPPLRPGPTRAYVVAGDRGTCRTRPPRDAGLARAAVRAAEQFRIAAGAKLLTDADPEPRGHAVEFRLTSEDAGRGFVPVPGTVTTFGMPAGLGIRVDAGVEAGDPVDGRYDSMFAKLVVSGADRDQALHRARRALAEVRVDGVPTPVPFYRQVVDHPDFAGRFAVHNRWIETEFDGVVEPWTDAAAERPPDVLPVRVGRQVLTLRVPGLDVLGERGETIRREAAALRSDTTPTASGNAVAAPMQGTIVRVAVREGQEVAEGDLIAVLEAMKMENNVLAHRAGVVTGLAVAVGDTVGQRTMICEVTPS